MSSNVLIIEFPGSSAEEVAEAYKLYLGIDARILWHDTEVLPPCDLLVIPGGSSFCDYLRPGALAKTSPIAPALRRYSRTGRVLGIGNGFQILCEYGVLPGTLLPNLEGDFINREVFVRVQDSCIPGFGNTVTGPFPLACSSGCYYLDRRKLADLEAAKQIVCTYVDKDGDALEVPPTGSVSAIAGVANSTGNAMGVMFHPERASDAVAAKLILGCLLGT
jgi:phosphoribosylformylglycinamidine synthase I